MKKLFIKTYSKNEICLEKVDFSKLPKNIFLAYSIQFKPLSEKVIKFLSKDKTLTGNSQVLGCSKPKIPKNTEAILLIGSGKFHASSLAYETKLPVFILENEKISQLPESEIKNFKKRQKIAIVNFLNSEKVGVLITTKPGQQRLKDALKIKVKNKDIYYFISNDLNTSEFENFPKIKSWVNTACPRMDMNSTKIINYSDIKSLQ